MEDGYLEKPLPWTEQISKSRTSLRKSCSSRTTYSTERERNSDFFLQLKSQVLKSGPWFSFAAFSACSRKKHLGVSTTSVPAGPGTPCRQKLYTAQRQDASPAGCNHYSGSAGTSVPSWHTYSSRAQRWRIPAIDWLQKHPPGWGMAKSRQIWQVCIDREIKHLGRLICSCRQLHSQVSVLPQDPHVYNPYERGTPLRGDVQGDISSARITLANADIEITSAIPTAVNKAAELSLGGIRKPSIYCPFITLLHIVFTCSRLKESLFTKGPCFQASLDLF